MEPPKMGEGVLGLSLGGVQGFSSSFFSALAGASAARTVSLAARGADRDTERAWTALPEKADLRAPETVGATRAAHCAEMIAAIMLALLSRCRACWLGARIARAATPIDAFQPAFERARSEGVGRVKSPLVSVTNQRRAFIVRFDEPKLIRMIRIKENRTIQVCRAPAQHGAQRAECPPLVSALTCASRTSRSRGKPMRAAPAGPSSAASTSAARCLRVAHARPRWAFAFGRARPPRAVERWCGPPLPAVAASLDGRRRHDGRRKTDWELMDEELRGIRAASHGRTALGVDYGRRRTGLAVSSGGLAPRPLEVVPSHPAPNLIRAVVDAALRERADEIVVGLPVPPKPPDADAARKREGPRAPVDLSRVVGGGARPKVRFPEDVEPSLGLDGMKTALESFGLKAGGTGEERAARIWALIEADGNLSALPARYFPGGAQGKARLVAAAVETAAASPSAPARNARDPRRWIASSPTDAKTDTKRRGRPPIQMHVVCRRFAENLADAAAPHGVPVRMYDESLTSKRAALAVEASRGARGLATGFGTDEHVDDVAAAILLERYFARECGEPIDVPPRDTPRRDDETEDGKE